MLPPLLPPTPPTPPTPRLAAGLPENKLSSSSSSLLPPSSPGCGEDPTPPEFVRAIPPDRARRFREGLQLLLRLPRKFDACTRYFSQA
jgi:hypothetical protein